MDLAFLYESLDDPRLDADIAAWAEGAERFHRAYKGKLSTDLGAALAELAELRSLANKVQVYLFLLASIDTGDAGVKAKMAEAEKIMNAADGEWLTFFDHELVALDDATIDALAEKDAAVAKHRPYVDLIRVFRPHLLKEDVEAALTKRSQFGPGAWADFFDEVEADLRFPWEDGELSLTELLHTLTDSVDAAERARALKAINDGLKGAFAKYSAQTLFMTAGAKEVEDRERGYRHPMEGRNKGSRIPDGVVEALHRAVEEHGGPLCRRYYRLKAAHLGLARLRWSDRNAPMPFADATVVPWDKAVDTVTRAYESFSPTLAGLVKQSVAAKRIDAPAVRGKRGGAFNYSICLPGSVPVSFTFLNYMGSNRDVMTLAHELGHGCHGLLAGETQGELMMHAPMAYAETASVFGEMTTFTYLKADLAAKGDAKSLLALVMGKLDDVMNTVVRQISFSQFERRVHGHDAATMTRKGTRRLSVEDLNAAWLDVTHAFYGKPGEVFDFDDADHLWTYIGHFHRPFYVYAYAFGELLTQSLYAARPKFGPRFEPLYLDLLRTGGTKDVVALLEPFGLDPTDPGFWKAGIDASMGALLSEAERLSDAMGVRI
jgi:oligoendopeptidase F